MFVDSDRKSVFSRYPRKYPRGESLSIATGRVFFLVTRESTPEGNRTPIKSLGNFYSPLFINTLDRSVFSFGIISPFECCKDSALYCISAYC